MTFAQLEKGEAIAQALSECPPLDTKSTQRDELWFTMRDLVCTRVSAEVVPLGSRCPVTVTEEHTTVELICAMEWLMDNEAAARELSAEGLFSRLRGAATRGAHGSARAAQADRLHGMTGVSRGDSVLWESTDELEARP
jgi:hypothetical protein